MPTEPIIVKLPWITLTGTPDRLGRWARLRCATAMAVHEAVELVAGTRVAHSMQAARRYAIGSPYITVPASRRNGLYLTTVGDFPSISGPLVNYRVVELRVYASGTVVDYEQIVNAGALVEVRISNPVTGQWELVGTNDHSTLTNLTADDHLQYQRAESIIVGADHTITSHSIVLTVEDDVTVTLPDAATNDGRTFTIVAGGTGTTVEPAGTDTINFNSGADPVRINNVRSYTSVNFGSGTFAYISTNVEGDVTNLPAWNGLSIPQGNVLAMGASSPQWGALAASQIPNLDAAKITSGTIGTARLGSGTASSSTFLRGDGSWQTVSATNKATVAGGQDEGATVNQTASATSLLDSTITLPACAAGDVLIISGGINIVQNSGAARTLTLGFKLGATTICSAATSFGAQSTARQSFFSIAVRVEATSDINASLLWSVGGVATLGATGVATENIGTGSLALDLLITGTANATQTYQLQNISVVKVAA